MNNFYIPRLVSHNFGVLELAKNIDTHFQYQYYIMITPVITHYSTQTFLEPFQTYTKTFATLTLTK